MTTPVELLNDLRSAIPDTTVPAVNIRPLGSSEEVDPVLQIQHAEIPRKSGELAVEGALIVNRNGTRLGVVEFDTDDSGEDILDIGLKPEAEEDPGLVEAILKGSVLILSEGKRFQRPDVEVVLFDFGDNSVEHRQLAA